MSQPDFDPAANLAAVQREIKSALNDADRADDNVKLIAVSKTHDAEKVRPLLVAGHRIFGENRVQEAAGKWPALKADYPDVELHLIGPLQSNKACDAVALFDVIETIDRPKIAKAIATEIKNQGRNPRLLVQINTGEEEQKAGVRPGDATAFLDACANEYGLTIDGLMCIPPVEDDPAPHFALLEKMARKRGMKTVSMGMSGDYTIAAQLGATHVRVGTAIFGARGSF